MKRLSAENERVVYLGNTNENLTWGWVQFPRLYPMKNGNIGLSVHDDDDCWVSFDSDTTEKWLVSENKGESWRPATRKDRNMMGTLLPNGDVIRPETIAPKSLEGFKSAPSHFATYYIPTDNLIPSLPDDPDQLPFNVTCYTDVFGGRYEVFWLDSLSDKIAEKRFRFHLLKSGEDEATDHYAPVEWKHRMVETFEPIHSKRTDLEPVMLNNPGLYICRDVKVAPDGSLYVAHYRPNGADPYTGVYKGCAEVYILRSTDNARSWKLHGYIPYQPDDTKDYFAHLVGGFAEPTLEFMPDGTILCLLRTCDVFKGAPEWGACYITRSHDGGVTWDKPEYFTDRAALPQLLRLKCGVTLAVITRPGIFVYASYDDGKTWSEKLEIMTDKDRSHLANVPPERPNFHQWAGSCCNCTILPIADDRAILSFSDFYIPDENGIKRKGIKTVEIAVR